MTHVRNLLFAFLILACTTRAAQTLAASEDVSLAADAGVAYDTKDWAKAARSL